MERGVTPHHLAITGSKLLRINTLGRLNVQGTDGRLLAGSAAQPRRLALLALLARAGDRGITRDRLVALLWPDADEDRARRGLSQALYALRQDLGVEEVFLGLKDLRLNPEVITSDVAEFETALAERDLTTAASCYGGPFLPGFHLSGAPEFERWADEERTRLGQRYGETLEQLARDAATRGDSQAAVGWWRKLAAQDPLNARSALSLMKALAAMGERSAALQHARVYESLIQQELDAPADPLVVEYAERLRREAPSPPFPGAPLRATDPAALEVDEPPDRLQPPERGTPPQSPAPSPETPSSGGGSARIYRRSRPADLAAIGVFVLIAGVLGALMVARRDAGEQLTLGASRRVAFEAALEVDPAYSPDGRVIAYIADYDGRMRLHVAQPGGRPLAITDSLINYPRSPRWSPDGSQIAFQSAGSIYIVPALGGPPRALITPGRDGWAASPAWSPDGREVAYVEDGALHARLSEGGESRRLLPRGRYPHSPIWSPDGRWIAFVEGNAAFIYGAKPWGSPINLGNVAPSVVSVVPARGGEVVRITDDLSLNTSPAWMPDSRTLLFVSSRDGERDVYQVLLNEHGVPAARPRRLSTGLGAHTISLSPDGRSLICAVYRFSSNIWSLPLPASGPASDAEAEPLTGGNQKIEGLALSPDGRWLAFDSDRSGNQDIYKIPIDGGEPIQLTDDAVDDFMSTWSPNGREIAYYSYIGGTRRVQVISAEGGEPRRVVALPQDQRVPDWSPDGMSLVFSSERTGAMELYSVGRNADSTWRAARRLTFEGGSAGRWAPDGRGLAFIRPDGIWVMAPQNGTARQLLKVEDSMVTPRPEALTWGADGRTIYYKAFDADGRSSIWSLATAGGTPRLLVRFDHPARQSTRPEFATDGRRLYFTLTAREADIWEMGVSGPK